MSYTNTVKRVILGGQTLVLYTEHPVKLTPVPGTSLHINLSGLTVRELAEAANLVGSYDYALPQNWFDEYMRKHKERPVGVWWYPRKDDAKDGAFWLMGRFVGVPEMVERIGAQLVAQGYT